MILILNKQLHLISLIGNKVNLNLNKEKSKVIKLFHLTQLKNIKLILHQS